MKTMRAKQTKTRCPQRAVFSTALCSLIVAMTANLQAGDIHDAAKAGNLKTLQTILEQSPNLVNDQDSNKMTPLMIAAREGKTEAVRALLDSGASVSAEFVKGGTALYIACMNDRPEIVGLLLDKGADPLAANDEGWSPARRAAQEGYDDVLAILKKKGVKIDPSWLNPEKVAMNEWRAKFSKEEQALQGVVMSFLLASSTPDTTKANSFLAKGYNADMAAELQAQAAGGWNYVADTDPRKFVSTTITGKKGAVKVNMIFRGGGSRMRSERTFSLIQENGNWKISKITPPPNTQRPNVKPLR